MITTVTPNPSIDRTLLIGALTRGAVLRARESTIDPGGKGVNISVALARNGRATTAVVPLGGLEGRQLRAQLDIDGLTLVAVPVAAPIRSNITLVEPDGTTTKINEPGPVLAEAEVRALLDTTTRYARGARWLVGSGSLPGNVDDTFYAQLAASSRARVAVDTTGTALIKAVEAGVALIKPNLTELLEATGASAHTLGDVIEIARDLRRKGDCLVLVSLGPDGAVLVSDEVHHGEASVVRLVSAVGAGDALLSGFLASGDLGRDGLATGLAWASAACEQLNTGMPTPAAIARQSVIIHDRVDMSRVLTRPGVVNENPHRR